MDRAGERLIMKVDVHEESRKCMDFWEGDGKLHGDLRTKK